MCTPPPGVGVGVGEGGRRRGERVGERDRRGSLGFGFGFRKGDMYEEMDAPAPAKRQTKHGKIAVRT